MCFDSKQYYRIQDSIYKKLDKQSNTVSNAEMIFYLVDWLDMQVHNGGWHQWYHNWKANERKQRINETIEALKKIGAVDTIVLLNEAVLKLDEGAECVDQRLLELNEDEWAQPDDLGTLTLQWANGRLHEFEIEGN